jgi:anaerobic selenocysteine-containing dehydrogenase
LAARLDHTWEFPSAQKVFHEMGRAVGALEGVSHVSLRGSSGRRLELGQYAQDDSLMTSAAEALGAESPVDVAPEEGEFLLVTGNVGHHFAHLTHQSEPIMNFASVPYALMHPDDCDSLAVETGHWIAVSSDRGRIEVTARPSPLAARGMIVIPVHYPAANPNRLRDRNRRADYVRIERIEGRTPDALKPRVAIAEVGAWTL